MAGTQITTYTTIITESMRGYQNITLTNWTNTNEPLIAEGGRTEIKGSLFKFDADEDVDPDADWAGFAMSTQIYGYYVVAGANVTSKLTTTAPTWSEEFGCWMDAGENYRYWGGIYKDSGGNYADKFIYDGRSNKITVNNIIDERGNIDLSGFQNDDKSIDFASDASMLWDESEDEFNFNKTIYSTFGRKPSGSLEMSNPTENNIFDALDAYIPTAGDEIILTGGASFFDLDVGGFDYNETFIFNRAVRLDADTIDIYFLYTAIIKATGGGVFNSKVSSNDSRSCDNGDATVVFDEISISW